jgi:hypothetical protein
MPNISDSDIVPEPYQMRLVMWRDEFTRGYFEIGDIANEIVLLNIKSGMNVEHAQIYSAVGRFCGKSGRTVRDYAEISSFFPEETRKEYDMLPFSHFRYAKSRGSEWREVLDYSMLHPDSSEGKLDFEFNFTSSDENILCEGVAVNNFSVASDVAPSVAVNLSGIYVLANLVSQAETILSWKMGKETRRKLLTALAGLKDVLQDLSENEQSLKFDYQATERPPRDGL